ncbi:hypothetical protein [Bradyrhizobium cenepequi]|uniref:hypothetical protein n=1 Tax=Bradyrhizobium cenepequi TaxID=2821403 RepID=UPI001CE296D9|nr:hypothetical protein [Bradyrhizobium cenepequi]
MTRMQSAALRSVASTCAVAFVARRRSISLSSSLLKNRFGGGGPNASPFHWVHTMAVDELGNVYNRRLEIEICGEQHWLFSCGRGSGDAVDHSG